MALDPFLDVVRFETEMTTEPIVGDRVKSPFELGS